MWPKTSVKAVHKFDLYDVLISYLLLKFRYSTVTHFGHTHLAIIPLLVKRPTGYEQFGFSPGSGTTNTQYSLCGNIMRYIGKIRKDCIVMVFIDLERGTYDRVPRQEV